MAEDPWYIETLGRVMEQNMMRTHCTRRGEGMTLKEHKYNWHKITFSLLKATLSTWYGYIRWKRCLHISWNKKTTLGKRQSFKNHVELSRVCKADTHLPPG